MGFTYSWDPNFNSVVVHIGYAPSAVIFQAIFICPNCLVLRTYGVYFLECNGATFSFFFSTYIVM